MTLSVAPAWSSSYDDKRPEGLGDAAVDEAGGREADLALPLLPRVACLLDAYEAELRGGHGTMTAAECLYFSLLEFQRRLDLLEIHELALRSERDAAAQPRRRRGAKPATDWRGLVVRKKEEASNALMERAKHYTIGSRSAETGLLQVAADVAEKRTLLQRFGKELEDEYADAVAQIAASIDALRGQSQEIFDAYLSEFQRSAAFWESEIESTFAEWVEVSKSMHQGSERQCCVWDELTMELARVFAWVHMQAFSTPASRGRGLSFLIASSEKLEDERVESILVEVCGRLLDMELQQASHGLTCPRRRALLRQALAAGRAKRCLARIGQHLLRNASFVGTLQRSSGALHRPAAASDLGADCDYPWVSWLIDIFGEFLMDLAVSCSCSQQAVEAGLLSSAVDGWSVIRAGARVYSDDSRNGRSPLHEAILNHNKWLVEQLIAAWADPLACDNSGETALSLARSSFGSNVDILPAAGGSSVSPSASVTGSAADE